MWININKVYTETAKKSLATGIRKTTNGQYQGRGGILKTEKGQDKALSANLQGYLNGGNKNTRSRTAR